MTHRRRLDPLRRALLTATAAAPLALGSTRLFALDAPGTSTTRGAAPRFLFVFLRGGYDAANLLVPISSSTYYEMRRGIAIARDAALPIDADWGLHPALRDSVHPLFTAGQAAFIPFAGTHDLSRSHFDTQDNIELGRAADAAAGASKNVGRSGFLNRLVAQLGGARAMAFSDQVPIAMQGPLALPNMALRGPVRGGLDVRQRDRIAAMYAGTPLAQPVEEGFRVREAVAADLAAEMAAADRNAASTRGFEAEARRIARLMKERYRIGFVDVGGWDTHAAQGGVRGALANHFEELGRGLAAYASELGPDWRDTVVVVGSEFGRTLRENGSGGTDHGHGSVWWVLGGSVKGGRVAGEQLRVAPGQLQDNRDYRVVNEYREVLGGLFARLWGLDAGRLDAVFPGARPRELGLV